MSWIPRRGQLRRTCIPIGAAQLKAWMNVQTFTRCKKFRGCKGSDLLTAGACKHSKRKLGFSSYIQKPTVALAGMYVNHVVEICASVRVETRSWRSDEPPCREKRGNEMRRQRDDTVSHNSCAGCWHPCATCYMQLSAGKR